MTETAQVADYVLPACSQFEKCESTFFTLEFPDDDFHLREPISTPFRAPCPSLRSTVARAEPSVLSIPAVQTSSPPSNALTRRSARRRQRRARRCASCRSSSAWRLRNRSSHMTTLTSGSKCCTGVMKNPRRVAPGRSCERVFDLLVFHLRISCGVLLLLPLLIGHSANGAWRRRFALG